MSDEPRLELQRRQRKLLFAVRRSVRYHARRRRFFSRFGKFTTFFATVGGVGTVASLMGEAHRWVTLIYGALAGFFSTIDLVVGSNEGAQLHADLSKDF